MSMYNCNRCDHLYDGDFVNCFEDPLNPRELICEDCHDEIQAEMEYIEENPMAEVNEQVAHVAA